ncbi:MAG: hypothetical protein ACLGI8_10195 [Acidimicrobiia bacterium]
MAADPTDPAPHRADREARAEEAGLVVRAWLVRDTGLAPAPPRHRRLPGALRQHRGEGPSWPVEVELRLEAGHLEVPGVGRWPTGEVEAAVVQAGPPVVVSLAVPGTRQLLAAPGDAATAELLRRLEACSR